MIEEKTLPDEIQLLPFAPEHLDIIDLRDGQENVIAYKHHIVAAAQSGIAVTLVCNNIIIGCGGVVNGLPLIGEVWLVCGRGFEQNKYLVSRTALSFLKFIEPFYHRLQLSARADSDNACRFAEHLGFHREGLQEKADPQGRNYYMYVKLR